MFYVKNVPIAERVVRVLAGVVAAGLAWMLLGGMVGSVVALSALGFVLTGLFGYCPACALAGRKLDQR